MPTTTTADTSVLDPQTAPAPAEREQRLAQIAQEVGDLPVLPHVAMRALKLAEREDWSVSELENEIVRDHALTARLLRLANSPYFGARCSITTIGRALNLIGISKTRSALLAASVEGLHENTRSNFPGKLLWDHALATASISQHFATVCQSGDPENAFMAGLLHDIGRPVMDARFTDQYRQVLDLVESDELQTLRDAEKRVFGFDHIDVGYLTAKGWDLPAVITNAILFHHDPDLAPADRGLCATVSLANSVCVKTGIGAERQPDLDLRTLASTQVLGLDESQLELLMKTPFTDTSRPRTV